MSKKKTKRDQRREERDAAVEEERAATEVFEERRRRFRIAAAVLPVVALAAAIGVYLATDDKQLAGLTGLVGVAIWIPLFLGAIGSQVTPRDRTRAGAIDFGGGNRSDKRR
ncbi:MAG: hypothetical protein KF729_24845 [Sandaracinaceae bacterium]|nr:hypothetical protein [Sandaracinaceae bacterium]